MRLRRIERYSIKYVDEQKHWCKVESVPHWFSTFVKAPRMTGQTNVRGGRECVMSAHKEKKKKLGLSRLTHRFHNRQMRKCDRTRGRGGKKNKKLHLLLPKHWRALVRRAQAGIESSHVRSVCTTTGTDTLSSGECCVREPMCELLFGRRWWGDGAPKSQQGDE